MTDRDDYKRLADEYQAGLDRMRASGYEEFDEAVCNHATVISALRAASVKAGEVVAWRSRVKGAQFWSEYSSVKPNDGGGIYEVEPLYTAPTASVGELRALRQFNVEDYVADYEFRDIGGEAGDHVPTGDERVLITDAVHGAIAEIEALAGANQSDGGVEGHASGAIDQHGLTDADRKCQPVRREGEITLPAGIKPGPSDTCPAPQAVEAVSEADLRSFIYVRQPCTSGELARALLAKFKMEER